VLKARREVVRGKPENFNRPDYNFRLDGQRHEPTGTRRCDQHRRAARRWT
jgi:exoribonuclease-2